MAVQKTEIQEVTPTQSIAEKVTSAANREIQLAQERKITLAQYYKDEEKVSMYLSAMYRPYFGNVMTVSVNGISIYFPVDGSVHKIPETFADIITERRMAVDAIQNKATRLSNIPANAESSPGELKLF